jgi:hypothetical protein
MSDPQWFCHNVPRELPDAAKPQFVKPTPADIQKAIDMGPELQKLKQEAEQMQADAAKPPASEQPTAADIEHDLRRVLSRAVDGLQSAQSQCAWALEFIRTETPASEQTNSVRPERDGNSANSPTGSNPPGHAVGSLSDKKTIEEHLANNPLRTTPPAPAVGSQAEGSGPPSELFPEGVPELTREEKAAIDSLDMTDIMGTEEQGIRHALRTALKYMRESKAKDAAITRLEGELLEAIRKQGNSDEALRALQKMLSSQNEKNPWLGVTSSVALLQLNYDNQISHCAGICQDRDAALQQLTDTKGVLQTAITTATTLQNELAQLRTQLAAKDGVIEMMRRGQVSMAAELAGERSAMNRVRERLHAMANLPVYQWQVSGQKPSEHKALIPISEILELCVDAVSIPVQPAQPASAPGQANAGRE